MVTNCQNFSPPISREEWAKRKDIGDFNLIATRHRKLECQLDRKWIRGFTRCPKKTELSTLALVAKKQAINTTDTFRYHFAKQAINRKSKKSYPILVRRYSVKWDEKASGGKYPRKSKKNGGGEKEREEVALSVFKLVFKWVPSQIAAMAYFHCYLRSEIRVRPLLAICVSLFSEKTNAILHNCEIVYPS